MPSFRVEYFLDSVILCSNLNTTDLILQDIFTQSQTLDNLTRVYSLVNGSKIVLDPRFDENDDDSIGNKSAMVKTIVFRVTNLNNINSISSFEIRKSKDSDVSFVILNPEWAQGLFSVVLYQTNKPFLPSTQFIYDIQSKDFYRHEITLNPSTLIESIDHLALGVPFGSSKIVKYWFQSILSMKDNAESVTVTEGTSSMLMETLESACSSYYIVIVEPVEGYSGQVHDFIQNHKVGVQHIAFGVVDIVSNMKNLENGRSFKPIPFHSTAWDQLIEKASLDINVPTHLMDDIMKKKENNVIVNMIFPKSDDFNYQTLSQVFSSSISSTCLIFFELIERKNGYKGFAPSNIASLFQSMEADLSVVFVDELLGESTYMDWANKLKCQNFRVTFKSLNCKSKEQLLRYLEFSGKSFDVIVSSFIQIDNDILTMLNEPPKLIHSQGAGYNHINLEDCSRYNISVCNNGDWCSQEVAEYSISVMMEFFGKIGNFQKQLKENRWDRNEFERQSVAKRTLGIVGYGKIGKQIGVIATALGMTVHIYDPIESTNSLEYVLSQADALSLNVPLTSSTYHLINQETLLMMKPNAIIINTSRGGVVDEKSIISFLDSGKLGEYVTDVFECEPLEMDHPLRHHPKCKVTPHIAGKTTQSEEKAAFQIIQNLENTIHSKPFLRLLTKPSDSVDDLDDEISLLRAQNTMRDIFDVYCKPGSDILNVSAGLVEFIPPMALRETAAELVLKSETNNMSEIKYFHMYRERLGDSIYVQAIQFLQEKHYDFGKFSKENILCTSGVSGGVISAIMMLKEKLNSRPGPVKIGLFNPFYVYHREIATGVFGTNVEFVYLDVNEDMSFDFQIIRENACHLDMIMFTNPGNPSTHVMTKEEVDQFVLVAQEFKHCYVISDEVYSDMIQPGFKHTSFHSPIPENIIVLRGFSKCMAVGSWRLGYALGHQDTIANLARSHDRVFICANWTQMAVGYYIMNQYEDYVQYLYNINLTMVKNYQMINNSILEMGWSILPPQGSMYLLCKHNCDDDLKAMVLLIKKGLVAVPGYMFMSDPLKQYNTGYLRFHVAYSLVKGQLVSDRLGK